jgi:hypothetical protein
MLLSGPSEHVLQAAEGVRTGGLQTSTLAIGLSRAAVTYLADEASRRDDLQEASTELCREVDALEKLKKALKESKFGEGGFNLIEIPYHPKLEGIVNALKKEYPNSIIKVLMPKNFGVTSGNLTIKNRLKDFEQADKIIFKTEIDKEIYMKVLKENQINDVDESKYQVKDVIQNLKPFEQPTNQRSLGAEKAKEAEKSEVGKAVKQISTTQNTQKTTQRTT